MKYKNFHIDKPEPNTPVYFICPTGQEILGHFKGGTWFESQDGKYKNYYSKFWRHLDESEMILVKVPEIIDPSVRVKRKYTKRIPSE